MSPLCIQPPKLAPKIGPMEGIKQYKKFLFPPVKEKNPHPVRLKNILGPRSRAGFKLILFKGLITKLIIQTNSPIKIGSIEL